MTSEEEALREVASLKEDLSAEKRDGHYETLIHGHYSSGGTYREEEVWVPEEPGPDIEKREAARFRLQLIYQTPGWISARRAAAEALGLEPPV